jgi:hypothetical protein
MKKTWKSQLKAIPLLENFYYTFKRWKFASLRHSGAEEIFTRYHRKNFWNDSESVSGSGSNKLNTERLVREIRPLLDQLGVASMLDIPCGDFQWMARVDLDGIDYTGGDVVRELAESLQAEHGRYGLRFLHLDLLEGALPETDLVFCRDCLVHLSFRDIWRALDSIKASGATYLATTSFPDTRRNHDIVTGDWRRLNFELPPFGWPEPDMSITEESFEGGGEYADKSICIWRLDRMP